VVAIDAKARPARAAARESGEVKICTHGGRANSTGIDASRICNREVVSLGAGRDPLSLRWTGTAPGRVMYIQLTRTVARHSVPVRGDRPHGRTSGTYARSYGGDGSFREGHGENARLMDGRTIFHLRRFTNHNGMAQGRTWSRLGVRAARSLDILPCQKSNPGGWKRPHLAR